MRLGRLRWWHLATVAGLEREIFGPEAWSESLLWTELSAGHDYRGAFDGESLVGYAGLVLGAGEAWINNIAVAPGWRRRGVARLLMDDMISRARAAGATALLLEVAVDNLPAQRLYDRYGFDGIGLRKNYYQTTGTDAAVMRMDL